MPELEKVRVVLDSNYPQDVKVFLGEEDLAQKYYILWPIKIEITPEGAFVYLKMEAKVDVLATLKIID